MADRLATIRSELQKHGQQHVLQFYDQLNPAQQDTLLDQLESFDYAWLDTLIEQYVTSQPVVSIPDDLVPAPYYRREAGDAALRQAPDDLVPPPAGRNRDGDNRHGHELRRNRHMSNYISIYWSK